MNIEIGGQYAPDYPGLTELLKRMNKLEIKASLATIGDTPNIDFVLNELGSALNKGATSRYSIFFSP